MVEEALLWYNYVDVCVSYEIIIFPNFESMVMPCSNEQVLVELSNHNRGYSSAMPIHFIRVLYFLSNFELHFEYMMSCFF